MSPPAATLAPPRVDDRPVGAPAVDELVLHDDRTITIRERVPPPREIPAHLLVLAPGTEPPPEPELDPAPDDGKDGRRDRRRGRTRRRWARVLTTVLIVLAGTAVATGVRMWSMNFGLPYMLHPDEPTNFYYARAMAVHGTLDPHFFNYPSLMLYLVAAWMRIASLSGLVGGIEPLHMLQASLGANGAGIARTSQPVLFLGARGISVALGVIMCLAVARATWTAVAQRRAMAFALLFVAVAPLAVTYSRFIAPDIYAACFYMLAVGCALKLMRSPRRSVYILGGVMVGLAAGSKYTGIAAILPLLVAHVAVDWRSTLRRAGIVWTTVACVVTFLITTPYTLIAPLSVWHGMQFEEHHYASDHPGYDGQSMHYYLSSLDRGYGWIMLGLAAIGLLMLLRWRPRTGFVLVTAIVPYYLYVGAQAVHFERNIVMIVGPLALLAGVGADGLLAAMRRPKPRLIASVAVALAVLLPASVAAREASTLGHDPRVAVQQYIAHSVPAGSTVDIEPYGPWVDPSRYHVRILGSLALHSPKWYRENGVDYLVAASETYSRFTANPRKYGHYVDVYHDVFDTFCTTRSFDDQGYAYRVLATNPDRCASTSTQASRDDRQIAAR